MLLEVDDRGIACASSLLDSSLGLPDDNDNKKSVAIRTVTNDVVATSCLSSYTHSNVALD